MNEAEATNSDFEWRPDCCDQVSATDDNAHFENKLDSSAAYDASKPADEATSVWAESDEQEGSASGWVDNGFKNTGTSESQWNGTSDLSVTDSLLSTDLHSHWFTASLVVNTGNKERCQ